MSTTQVVISDKIRSSWGWFMSLGIAFTILGMVCVIYGAAATYTTAVVFGWMLLLGGLFQLIDSFRAGEWSGFFIYLLDGLIRAFTGFLLILYPSMSAGTLTLVVASFLIVSGLFRAIGSGTVKFPRWAWSVSSGVISALFGFIVLAQMPAASLWLVGFSIGVDLVFDGIAIMAFASAIHTLPGRTAVRPA